MTKESQTSCLHTLDDTIDHTLLAKRRIFISSGIDSDVASEVIRKLWYLEIDSPGKPILLVINSPGGSVDAGLAIWDTVKMISSPVSTLVTGLAASMGSILSLCAEKGHRFATPYSRIMIHQPAVHGVVQGQATDLEIQAKEILKTRQRLVNIYVDATGKSYDDIDEAIDRDLWMTPEEAKKFGLIDAVISSFKDVK